MIRDNLIHELTDMNVCWPYKEADTEKLSDEWLIEKILLHSDLDSIYRLFDIFPEAYIRSIWEQRLLPDRNNYSMNLLFALLLFHIDNPEQYLQSKIE